MRPLRVTGSKPIKDCGGFVRDSSGCCLQWHFDLASDPRRVELAAGIPWMLAIDRLHLREMFERPARVAVQKS